MKPKNKPGQTKTMWIGHIPEIFGYGIMVAESTEKNCIKALRKAYREWTTSRKKSHLFCRTFNDAMEHWGGRVHEIELGKSYFDDFN